MARDRGVEGSVLDIMVQRSLNKEGYEHMWPYGYTFFDWRCDRCGARCVSKVVGKSEFPTIETHTLEHEQEDRKNGLRIPTQTARDNRGNER